jgi:hypothetical protein
MGEIVYQPTNYIGCFVRNGDKASREPPVMIRGIMGNVDVIIYIV